MPTRAFLKSGACLTAVATLAYHPSTAIAQEGFDDSELDRIVVTAQKREQSLQDVPIAITVFDEAAIEIQRIDELQDYLLKTPNVGFIEGGNRNRAQIGIRGITNLGVDINTTGFYIDEFNVAPSSSTRTFDINLFDVERIEVLRGPQGTFFGRNTLGGALNITTKKPSTDGFSGEATAEYGSFDHHLFRSSLNIPLSDRAAIRATGYYQADDGFIDNVGPSGRGNDREDYGARLGLRFMPDDNWTIDAGISYVNYEQGANSTVPNGRFLEIQADGYVDLVNTIVANPLVDLSPIPVNETGFLPNNTDTIATDFSTNSLNETLLFTLRNIVDFGEHTLTSVTGYIDSDYFEAFDGDQSSFSLVQAILESELRSFSHEIRLNGPVSKGLYTIGFLYAEDKIEGDSLQLISDDGAYFSLFALSGIEEGVFTRGLPVNETKTIALFGNVEWPLTDTLTFGIGGRYTNDRISNSNATASQFTEEVQLPTARSDFSDFSTSFVLTYEPTTDLTAYASVKQAYKPGGVRAISLGQFEFDEESAWAYEIGTKFTAFDGRLRTNAAAFFTDWSDLQVSARDPNAIASAILNAAEAENYGVEIESVAQITDDFSVDVGLGYLEAEFGTFDNALSAGGTPFDATGNRIPFSPRYSVNLGAQYERDLGNGREGYIRAEYIYKADQFGDVENTERGTRFFEGASGD